MPDTSLNWFTSIFSAEANEEDLVKSRTLNATRVTSIGVPLLAGIAAAIAEVAERKPFNDHNFQKVLIVALIAFVGVLTAVDMLVRAISARRLPPVAVALPGFKAQWKQDDPPPHVPGKIIAFRAANGEAAMSSGEYYFVPDKTPDKSCWVSGAKIEPA